MIRGGYMQSDRMASGAALPHQGRYHRGSADSPKKNKGTRKKQDICVSEELKIAVNIALEKFRMSETQKELEFPSSLTSTERAYVHQLCVGLGIKTKSKGKGSNRNLTMTKRDGNQTLQSSAMFQLAHNSRQQIANLLRRYPVSNKERQDLIPRAEGGLHSEGVRDVPKATTGRLNNGVPQVPPKRSESELSHMAKQLPINALKDEILSTIHGHQVVLIQGETGSGKTTQVPQMILDEHYEKQKPCRIFCTQPRRISVLSVSDRVAAERAEKIGQTVGYQIRLESRVSPKTLLTFCTNGVLLRTLMGGENALSSVTHVIVDEIHERDRFSDFLLISLRDMLSKYRNLTLILMSAALNVELFVKYFNGCPIINVPGNMFLVEEYFLEDVLKWTGYSSKNMDKYRQELTKNDERKLAQWCHVTSRGHPGVNTEVKQDDRLAELIQGLDVDQADDNEQPDEDKAEAEVDLGLDPDPETWLSTEMDQLLTAAWHSSDEDDFSQIVHLIVHENISVDYQHSETSATALMVACGRGLLDVVEELIGLGANIKVRASNEWTALNWAKKFEQNQIIELLEAYINSSEMSADEINLSFLPANNDQLISAEDRELLKIYQHSFDDEKVDLDLIMSLLSKIMSGARSGAILVFLPGYDDIVTLRDRILYDEDFFSDSSRYVIYTLHSAMQSSDQKRVFRPLPQDQRKIILSTNIAETSITINDVVYVIDAGKVKEKTYDALTSMTNLKSNWISKASALQRKGRAGRCQNGVCYHLFSRIRHQSMQEYQLPEILRFPLTELCLHTKMLAPPGCAIADFISRAPQAPPFMVTRNAVQLLKQIDALDSTEDLTELGVHLPDLPVDPRLGKMVLYAVVMKCLDPILTIVCTLAYRDPFVLPSNPAHKRASLLIRRKFAADTFSDHMAYLRAFQAWQKAKADGWERTFCEKNFISGATMEMIVGMRTQLLGQLRASGFVRARGGGDIRDLNTNSESWVIVKAALSAGMYPSLLCVDRLQLQLKTQREGRVRFHTSSVLNQNPSNSTKPAKAVECLPSDWLIYDEMSSMYGYAHARCCTVISAITLAIFGGASKLPLEYVKEVESFYERGQDGIHGNLESDSEGEDKEDVKKTYYKLDEWITFRVDPEAANLAMSLRQKWHSLFIRRMRGPAKPWSLVDEAVLRVIISVLTSEEQALGLQQPAGIGQRPRPMSAESGMHGGSRRSSFDTESSESSGGDSSRATNKFLHKKTSTPPRENKSFSGNDDKCEVSSVRSGSSQPGSGSNSLRSTPCHSPQVGQQSAVIEDRDRDRDRHSSHSSARYFVMKSSSHKNLDVSAARWVWSTTSINERKLNKAYKDGKTVNLIFSVQGSGHFQGYAKMTSMVTKDKVPEFSSSSLNGSFSVEWIKKANLPFQQTHHLLNSWNDNKKVQVSRDGQEIEPSIGEALIRLWERFPTYMWKSQRYSKGQRSDDGSKHGKGQGQGYGGVGYQGGGFTGVPQAYVSQPGMGSHAQIPPGHRSPFAPLYISPCGSPGGVMISPPQMSPGHCMSPVIILQRGSPTPRHNTPPQSLSPYPGQNS